MKQIFIFRKTYAAVILIGYLMAFSSAWHSNAATQCFTRNNNEVFQD